MGKTISCKIAGKSENVEGTLKWIGKIKKLSKNPNQAPPLIVGIELFKDENLATDGSFLGVKYFKTSPKRAYFVPAKLCNIKAL